MQAAGYVLVGGKSSRMGRDKALLPGRFRYLLDDVAEGVRTVAGNVTLVGRADRFGELHYDCISDLRPCLGPLAGLEAALISSSTDLNLVLACDMPAIDVTHLRRLLERAQVSKSGCIVTEDAAGKVHPLCAVYKKACLAVIQCRLDEKRLSLMGLLEEVATEYIRAGATVENINTPEEWTRWNLKERRNAGEASRTPA